MLSTVKSCIALYLTLLYPLYWATIKKLHLKKQKKKIIRGASSCK